MIDGILMICGSILIIILWLMLLDCRKDSRAYRDQWERWKAEYWLLRQSDAIKSNYEVHLSWTERGMDNAISKTWEQK